MSMEKPRLLVADDERGTLDAMARFLKRRFTVDTADDGVEAAELLKTNRYDLVLTDLRMPGADGMSVLEQCLARDPAPACVILSAYGTVESAVEAVKRGAFDFVVKPIRLDRLQEVLDRALEAARTARRPAARSASGRAAADELDHIVSGSPAMQQVMALVRQVAPSRATVLLTGESGTGKEVIARALHQLSHRTGAFIPVHCAALPATLLESELFGHEKGAFTGATEQRKGRFELAQGGTLFLDEIGEIDLSTQVKLLRVLESRRFERLGGGEELQSDARIIAATNRDLEKMVAAGTFREDLFYRLNVVNLQLPPLREHPEDVPALVNRFVAEVAADNARSAPVVTPEAMKRLTAWSWPGNVRELRNCVERMVVLASGDTLDVGDLPPQLRSETPPAVPSLGQKNAGAPAAAPALNLEDNERQLIEQALAACHGNRTLAAERLGISRRTLHRRLKEYGL